MMESGCCQERWGGGRGRRRGGGRISHTHYGIKGEKGGGRKARRREIPLGRHFYRADRTEEGEERGCVQKKREKEAFLPYRSIRWTERKMQPKSCPWLPDKDQVASCRFPRLIILFFFCLHIRKIAPFFLPPPPPPADIDVSAVYRAEQQLESRGFFSLSAVIPLEINFTRQLILFFTTVPPRPSLFLTFVAAIFLPPNTAVFLTLLTYS